MDIKRYSEEVCKALDKMSDEEFMKALKEAGLEKCPYIGIDLGNGNDFRVFRNPNGSYWVEENKIE